MRVHNHRIALNTRMANRFGNSRLHKGYMPPVTVCEHVGHGSAGDTFRFIANSTDMVLIMVMRLSGTDRPNIAMNVSKGTRVRYTGNFGGDTRKIGQPYLQAQHQTGLVVGEEVTVRINDTTHFMPGYSMCYAIGVNANGMAAPFSKFVGWSLDFSTTQTGESMHFAPSTQTVSAFWLVAHTSHQRGPMNFYTSYGPTITLDAIICNGEAVDNPSLNPPEVTGGWYGASFWTRQPSSRDTWASVNWPSVSPAGEFPSGECYMQVQLLEGASFVGMAHVEKV